MFAKSNAYMWNLVSGTRESVCVRETACIDGALSCLVSFAQEHQGE